MEELYLLEPAVAVRKDGECLRLEFADGSRRLVPAAQLRHLVVAGRQSLSGAVLSFLIEKRVDTVFLSPTGRFLARLLLDEPGHVELRRRQYAQLGGGPKTLPLARAVVAGKLANQQRLLSRRANEYREERLGLAAKRIRALRKQCAVADDLDILRGIEGFGSRIYFESFPLLIRNEAFPFNGRNKRPPRDPVNALLSFGYTVFTNQAASSIRSAGLDPALGALHVVEHGRPSLACDLVEEYRCLVDRLVLTLLNRRLVGREDFVSQAGGVLMKPDVLRVLVRSLERLLDSRFVSPATGERVRLRHLMYLQARSLVAWLQDEKEGYEPFALP